MGRQQRTQPLLPWARQGWVRRPKQFGLEQLAALGQARRLRDLSLCMTGARVTSDCFRQVIAGIVQIPVLRTLTLDLHTCDLGEQCNRGLGLLRTSTTLEVLDLRLRLSGSGRVLLALGAIRYAPRLNAMPPPRAGCPGGGMPATVHLTVHHGRRLLDESLVTRALTHLPVSVLGGESYVTLGGLLNVSLTLHDVLYHPDVRARLDAALCGVPNLQLQFINGESVTNDP